MSCAETSLAFQPPRHINSVRIRMAQKQWPCANKHMSSLPVPLVAAEAKNLPDESGRLGYRALMGFLSQYCRLFCHVYCAQLVILHIDVLPTCRLPSSPSPPPVVCHFSICKLDPRSWTWEDMGHSHHQERDEERSTEQGSREARSRMQMRRHSRR